MIFGGIANTFYGSPRQTFDIDIKVILKGEDKIRRLISRLESVGTVIPENPVSFIHETGVLPVEIAGVRVDIVFATLPFEERAISRRRSARVMGVNVKICSLEDLIIQKAVSIREKDWMDIQTIIRIKKEEMDWEYLIANCRELADLLNRPDIYSKIEGYQREA